MFRTLAATLCCVTLAAPGAAAPDHSVQSPTRTPPQHEPEEVRFHHGDLRLGGLWFAPDGNGPFAAAVFLPGSGPSNRQHYWTRSIIRVFLNNRTAVLLPDKRGSDSSEGDWRTATFGDLADDALAGVSYAQSRPDVDPERVGVVGLSQGGKIAPLAASRSHAVAFVIDFVGAATPLVDQLNWEMYYTFRESGVEGGALQEALSLQVLAERYVRGQVKWTTYRAALQRALDGPAADVAKGFPSSPDAWQWTFFRNVLDYDPVPYWRRVTQPVLVLYGEDDHNGPTIQSTYRLIRVWQDMDHPDATLRVFESGHGLFDPDSDPHAPTLRSDLVTTLGDWISSRTRTRPGPE